MAGTNRQCLKCPDLAATSNMYAPCSLLILRVSRQGRCLAFPTRVYQHAPASPPLGSPVPEGALSARFGLKALAFSMSARACAYESGKPSARQKGEALFEEPICCS